MLKQSLSQTTSALEDSERHVEQLSSDLAAAKKNAGSIKSRVRTLDRPQTCTFLSSP